MDFFLGERKSHWSALSRQTKCDCLFLDGQSVSHVENRELLVITGFD